MSLPKWDEEMKFELLRLKSELRPDNFRALHTPIGLGRLIGGDEAAPASTLGSALFPQPKLAQPLFSPTAEKIIPTEAPLKREAPLASVPPLPDLPSLAPSGMTLSKRLLKTLMVHSLDIAFVTLTLGLGLLFANWLNGSGNVSENTDLLKQAAPLRFLKESSTLAIVLGVYGFFSFYWLFFKLVSGSTLAESFLDNFWTLQNPRNPAPVKDSGDS